MPVHKPSTPEELLAELSHNDPIYNKKRAAEIIDKCRLVTHYVDAEIRKRIKNSAKDSEEMFALHQARREAISLRLAALSVRKNTLKDFNTRVKAMDRQYDTLVSSIRHLTLLVPSPEEG